MKRLELEGRVFTYLTVIGKAASVARSKDSKVGAHLCRCICDKQLVVRNDHLTRGTKKSCGCKKNELISEAYHSTYRPKKKKTPDFKAIDNAWR